MSILKFRSKGGFFLEAVRCSIRCSAQFTYLDWFALIWWWVKVFIKEIINRRKPTNKYILVDNLPIRTFGCTLGKRWHSELSSAGIVQRTRTIFNHLSWRWIIFFSRAVLHDYASTINNAFAIRRWCCHPTFSLWWILNARSLVNLRSWCIRPGGLSNPDVDPREIFRHWSEQRTPSHFSHPRRCTPSHLLHGPHSTVSCQMADNPNLHTDTLPKCKVAKLLMAL